MRLNCLQKYFLLPICTSMTLATKGIYLIHSWTFIFTLVPFESAAVKLNVQDTLKVKNNFFFNLSNWKFRLFSPNFLPHEVSLKTPPAAHYHTSVNTADCWNRKLLSPVAHPSSVAHPPRGALHTGRKLSKPASSCSTHNYQGNKLFAQFILS